MNGIPVERTYDWHRAVVGRVSTEALALVLVLSNRMNPDGTLPRRFTPSLETMSQEMGYAPNSRRAIVRAMKELKQKGFLAVEHGGGRKTTNSYRATVPLVVAQEPQQAAETVASDDGNGGAEATHPTPAYSNPTQARRAEPTLEERKRRATVANKVFWVVCEQLPPAEAEALQRSLAELKSRNRMRDAIVRLVDAGQETRVVSELTAVKMAGTASPYERCEHPARVAWSRVRDLCRQFDLPA